MAEGCVEEVAVGKLVFINWTVMGSSQYFSNIVYLE
jgi:hypothetical protein